MTKCPVNNYGASMQQPQFLSSSWTTECRRPWRIPVFWCTSHCFATLSHVEGLVGGGESHKYIGIRTACELCSMTCLCCASRGGFTRRQTRRATGNQKAIPSHPSTWNLTGGGGGGGRVLDCSGLCDKTRSARGGGVSWKTCFHQKHSGGFHARGR